MKQNKELSVAIKAAEAAGAVLMENFGGIDVVNRKSRTAIVTEMDLKADEIITSALKKSFPSYGFLSEEKSNQDALPAYCWVIDPIDGTANYVAGLSDFAVSIALVHNSEPLLGVVFKPFYKELFCAEKGKGAFLNGKKASVGRERSLAESYIGGDWGHNERQRFIPLIEKLLPKVRYIQMSGSAVVGLTNVACGRMQAYVHNDLKPWDVAASAVIIREAGGKITDFNGNNWRAGEKTVIASNDLVHKEILEILKELNK